MLAKITKKILQTIGISRVKTFKHGGNMGDIIYSLPTIIALGGGKLYIGKGTPYMGQPVTDATVSQMSELLKTQRYITDVCAFQGEKIDYDLDKFREHNMNRNLLSVCHLRSFGVTFDLSQPWLLNITPIHIAEIVINRTMRYVGEDPNWPTLYHGKIIEWGALKDYESKCVFIGFDEEYSAFQKETGLDTAKYEIGSALEFARIIRGSSLYIGNQSFGYALAEAMKHPRILEVCPYAPNCMPQSSNGHVELTREIIEDYLRKQAKEPPVKIRC